ncbi:MAG: helix-turn-helix transcriptional regulator [Clostridia bacterium]|nr:helix-turn-helix transcriptional regulator [Clostridia bacterium]
MKELISGIASYVEHVKNMGLNLSVHYSCEAVSAMPTQLLTLLSPFNVHTNPYCMWVKKNDGHRCIESQQKLIKEGKSGFRNCPSGVLEYITPFYKDGVAIGIVAISGFRGDKKDSVNEALWEQALSGEPFPKELADTLVMPLTVMLEKLFESEFEIDKSEYNEILQYLNEYYATATLDSICRHFHRSRSHVSHLFKKNSGTSLRAYCNGLKLKESERLLRTTDLPVTRIALETGFNDVSHFINLFRQKYGVSPLAYRKSKK